MHEEFLKPLNDIIQASEELLTHTELDELQRKFVLTIHTLATQLRDMVFSIPDFSWERAREIFSFETRSHLNTIIGYSEELLDLAGDSINEEQQNLVRHIENSGRTLLDSMTRLINSG